MMSPIYGQYAFLVCAHSGELLPEFLDRKSIILRSLLNKEKEQKKITQWKRFLKEKNQKKSMEQKIFVFDGLSLKDNLVYLALESLEDLRGIVSFNREISEMIHYLKGRFRIKNKNLKSIKEELFLLRIKNDFPRNRPAEVLSSKDRLIYSVIVILANLKDGCIDPTDCTQNVISKMIVELETKLSEDFSISELSCSKYGVDVH